MRALLAIAAVVGALGCDQAAPVDPALAPEEPARARDYRSPRVTQAVEAASEVVRTRGFAAEGEPSRGFLVDRAAEVSEQAMRTGTCYVLLAAGSAEIRELDVRVFDSDGGEVVQDANTGSRSALRFCPSQSGTYFVAVQASAGSGLYELRRFRGPTGLEIRIDDLFREVTAVEPREPR